MAGPGCCRRGVRCTGGVEHGDMRLAAYGGTLFDPDRYPFLEGRQPGSSWVEDEADPLEIDNRTVLHLLNALQTLDEGGQRRKLSFRALDVEQIGHVYEGMLDHTATRAEGWVIGLSGTGGREPEIELDHLEALDHDALLDLLKDKTGRGIKTTERWMAGDQPANAIAKFGTAWSPAFDGPHTEERVRRFAKLIRPDSTGAPTVFQPGSVYVADSSHRGATGTHYTPRTLTEEIVKHTLDPLIYDGPSEGKPESAWTLRTPEEILDLKICDPACGSGAFLVQACRYLADHLTEAQRTHGQRSGPITDDEITQARRLTAENCLHGVDINPMACEMAKLSLWLITLARDQPFSFLDHAIRTGDSLLGVGSAQDLVTSLNSGAGTLFDLRPFIDDELEAMAEVTERIRAESTSSMETRRTKERLFASQEERSAVLAALADVATLKSLVRAVEGSVAPGLVDDPIHRAFTANIDVADDIKRLAASLEERLRARGEKDVIVRPRLHWFIAFPHVAGGRFDAIAGNPPFVAGTDLLPTLGRAFREHLVRDHGYGVRGRRGQIDLCVYFVLRAVAQTRAGGRIGLVAVNTISEGDSRQVGLEQIVKDHSIYRAIRSERWPGVASLEIAKLWIGPKDVPETVLDGLHVSRIGPDLRAVGQVTGRAQRLAFRQGRQSKGSQPLGTGFILDPIEADQILQSAPNESEVIRPFLNAQDLNSRPGSTPSRYIINFGELSEEESRRYENAFRIVEERVKPERLAAGNDGWRARVFDRWWQFEAPRTEIYHWAKELGGLTAIAGVSNTVMPQRVAQNVVLSQALFVFRTTKLRDLALLSSAPHYWWTEKQCSSMRTDIRYTPTEIFETLPSIDLSDSAGEQMQVILDTRAEIGERVGLGLTAIYKRVADPSDGDPLIQILRDAHAAIDETCIRSLGITTDLRHDHYEHEYGRRFTPHPEVRLQVLDRLLELNFETFEAELEQGLHDGARARWVESDGVRELVVEGS